MRLMTYGREVLQEEKRLHNRRKRQNHDNSQRSQRAANARRARRAVEDGQYRKAIQALASDGLALPTVEAVQAEAIRTLVPLQVGVGISAGCEAIVHSVSCVAEGSNISPDDRWTLLLDFSNAFNSVDRGVMFKEMRARIPLMSAWMESYYGSQPILRLRVVVECSRGIL